MLKHANIIDFEEKPCAGAKKEKKIKLLMGRKMVIRQEETGEIIRLLSGEDEVIVQIQMTQAGPVVSVNCGTLELNAAEKITLAAKKVEINAEESAVIKSKGALEIESSKKLGVKSEDDIAINGKIIHLN
ncbi:MAG: hypothetical protein HGB33_00475 [Syntrophaceae bacterium]|nr:hypothetical protein [Syntrophaceae bacterium]NTW76258.1 hypothetical protein [Syntrophaceae bacterium]